MKPIVSVIMPVYNAEEYLEESIESILNQTFKDFELLIINDGSTDSSLDILNRYKQKDYRIRVISNEGNKGLPYTRDRGLKLATGEYIALMDADDVSYKTRLEKQVKLLNNNKDIMVVASNFDFLEGNKIIKNKQLKQHIDKECNNREVNYRLMFHNPIGNSTVMFRKDSIDKFNIRYRKDCFIAQDYAFWVDCIGIGKFYIMDECLVAYRQGHENITKKSIKNKSRQRKQIIDSIRTKAIERNNFNFSIDNLDVFNKVFSDPYVDLEYKDFNLIFNIINNMIISIDAKIDKTELANIAKYQIARRLSITTIPLKHKIKVIIKRLENESLKNTLISIFRVFK